jgi:hypothetical protein
MTQLHSYENHEFIIGKNLSSLLEENYFIYGLKKLSSKKQAKRKMPSSCKMNAES